MSGFYTAGLVLALQDGLPNLTLKLLLVQSSYTFDPDHSDTESGAIAAAECTATNYARKSVEIPDSEIVADTTNDQVDIGAREGSADYELDWTDLGDTDDPAEEVGGAIIFDDTSKKPILFWPIGPTTVDGCDGQLVLTAAASGGMASINCEPPAE